MLRVYCSVKAFQYKLKQPAALNNNKEWNIRVMKRKNSCINNAIITERLAAVSACSTVLSYWWCVKSVKEPAITCRNRSEGGASFYRSFALLEDTWHLEMDLVNHGDWYRQGIYMNCITFLNFILKAPDNKSKAILENCQIFLNYINTNWFRKKNSFQNEKWAHRKILRVLSKWKYFKFVWKLLWAL